MVLLHIAAMDATCILGAYNRLVNIATVRVKWLSKAGLGYVLPYSEL